MDEDKWGRVSNAVDGTSVSRRTSSFVDADTPLIPQDTGKKIYLDPQSQPQVHQKSLLESPSSSVSPPKSVTAGLPQKDKCLPTRKRSADESLITTRKVKSQLDPSISPTVLPTSCVATSPLLVSNSKEIQLSSPKEDALNVQHFAELISIIKTLKHGGPATGGSASSQNVVGGSHVPHPSTKKVGRWDSDVQKATMNPKLPSATSKEDQPVGNKAATEERIPFRSVGTNDTIEKQPEKDVDAQSTLQNEAPVASSPGVAGDQNSGQISQPQSEVASTVCQTHINRTKVNGGHQLAHCVSAAASGHCSHNTQTVNRTNEQVSSSAEPEDANTSNTPLVYNAEISHNPGSNSPALFYPNQINARQEVNSCVHLGGQKTSGGLGLEVLQQQQMQQQMQQLLLKQQILQEQLHQCQVQQAKQQQIHQYQMYQLQQSNQEQVHQHQIQQQMHQYQMYQHQYQMYWQQQSSQGQVLQQPYSQYSAGMSMAPPAQHHANWVRQNLPPFYPTP